MNREKEMEEGNGHWVTGKGGRDWGRRVIEEAKRGRKRVIGMVDEKVWCMSSTWMADIRNGKALGRGNGEGMASRQQRGKVSERKRRRRGQVGDGEGREK